jgi:hypothetical protein
MKRILSVFAVALLAVFAVSCTKDNVKELNKITFDQKTVTLKPGQTATIAVTFDPADMAPELTWESSNTAVATVADGVITAVAPGTATITAKAQGKTAVCNVTVEADDPGPGPGPGPEPEPDLTIYGNLAAWEQVPAVAGTGIVNRLRVALDQERIYFLLEAPLSELCSDEAADFANYCVIYYSNGAGEEETDWNQNYSGEKSQLWLMSKGEPKVSNWDDGKEKEAIVRGDIAYFVYSIPRANKEILNGGNLYVGLTVNNQTVTHDENGKEIWSDFEVVGYAPAAEGDMLHVIVGEEPAVEPEDTFDYTPGDAYSSSANLWKPVDDANAVNYYYYNCTGKEWNGNDVVSAEVPFLKKTNSTYRLYYPEATTPGEIWMKQFFMFPFDDSHFIALDPAKTYDLSITLAANKDCPGFFKIEQYNPDHFKREGAVIWEKPGGIQLTTEPQVIEKKGITGIDCNNIILIFAFGGNTEQTYVYIKDITLVESEGTEPVVDTFDPTPGEEYLADGNLWKPVDDANALKYFWYRNPGWAETPLIPDTEGTECPFVEHTQSTFKVTLAEATYETWQNQLFFHPFGEDHFIALDPAKTYKFKATIQSPNEFAPFFKISTYNPGGAPKYEGGTINEPGVLNLTPNVPVVVEAEFTGIEATNILLVFGLGGNPANTTFYVKDITLVEVGGEAPAEGITIDGKFDDWAELTEYASSQNSRIRWWKFDSDAENVYFFLKLRGDRLGKKMHISFDTDNDESTGGNYGNYDGTDVGVTAFPVVEGTSDFVSGFDAKALLGSTEAPELVYCAGAMGEDNEGYVEIKMSRAALGLPASGTTIAVGCAYDWYVTGKQTFVLK